MAGRLLEMTGVAAFPWLLKGYFFWHMVHRSDTLKPAGGLGTE